MRRNWTSALYGANDVTDHDRLLWSFLDPNTLVGWSDEVNDGEAFIVR